MFIDSDCYQELADFRYKLLGHIDIKPFDIVYSKIEHAPFFCIGNKDIPCILITDCDLALNNHAVSARGDNIVYWFGTNVTVVSPTIEAIPIGLPQVNLFNNISDRSYIKQYQKSPIKKTKLAYMNHSISTNYQERYSLYRDFKNRDWVTQEGGLLRIPYKDYIIQLAQHYYVFSPPGAGIDCHRTWEALYVKTVPIVKDIYAMSFFKDLPMLFVKDYSEVTPELLLENLPRFKKMFETTIPKLDFTYWKNRIITKQQECKNAYLT